MTGNVVLSKEQIKKVLKEYYKNKYGNCSVLIKEVRDENELTGIIISHKYIVSSNIEIDLEEELSIEDLKEVFSDIFSNSDYVADHVYLDTHVSGSGFTEFLNLNSVNIILKKHKVKCKIK